MRSTITSPAIETGGFQPPADAELPVERRGIVAWTCVGYTVTPRVFRSCCLCVLSVVWLNLAFAAPAPRSLSHGRSCS